MLDLRLPIGYLFIIIGTILTIYGFAQPTPTLVAGQSINLNISWGSLMGVFGIFMCALAFRNKESN